MKREKTLSSESNILYPLFVVLMLIECARKYIITLAIKVAKYIMLIIIMIQNKCTLFSHDVYYFYFYFYFYINYNNDRFTIKNKVLAIPNNCVTAKYVNLKSEIQVTTTRQRGAMLGNYSTIKVHSRFSVGKMRGNPNFWAILKPIKKDIFPIKISIRKVSYSVRYLKYRVTCTNRGRRICAWWWYSGEMSSSAKPRRQLPVPSAASGSRLQEAVCECRTKSDASPKLLKTTSTTSKPHTVPINVKFIDICHIKSNKIGYHTRKLQIFAVSQPKSYKQTISETKRLRFFMHKSATRLNCQDLKYKKIKTLKIMNNLSKLRPLLQNVAKSEAVKNAKQSLTRIGEGIGILSAYEYIRGDNTENVDIDNKTNSVIDNKTNSVIVNIHNQSGDTTSNTVIKTKNNVTVNVWPGQYNIGLDKVLIPDLTNKKLETECSLVSQAQVHQFQDNNKIGGWRASSDPDWGGQSERKATRTPEGAWPVRGMTGNLTSHQTDSGDFNVRGSWKKDAVAAEKREEEGEDRRVKANIKHFDELPKDDTKESNETMMVSPKSRRINSRHK